MTESPFSPSSRPRGANPEVMILLLRIVAVLVLVAAVVIGVLWLHQLSSRRSPQLTDLLLTLAIVVAGGVFAAALWAGSLMLDYGYRLSAGLFHLHQLLEHRGERSTTGSATQQPGAARGVDLAVLNSQLQRVVELLDELQENTLLDVRQRREKRLRMQQRDKDRRIAAIESLMSQRQWGRARAAVEQFKLRYPQDERIAAVAERLELQAARAEGRDLAQAKRDIEDCLAISAFDRAARIAAELLEKHPFSEQARELAEHVQRERAGYQLRRRRQMYAEIERASNAKQWQRALRAAEEFVRQFPDTVEAEDLRSGKLEILKANAEIEIRQQKELEIKELIRKRRYREALAVAEEVIRDWPESKSAETLMNQLPRLRQKAQAEPRVSF